MRGTANLVLPPTVESASYAYLLGIYLGDGHVARRGRSMELRIYCDSRYPGIVEEICAAIRHVRPLRAVRVSDRPNARCRLVASGWTMWPLAFPQHGRGKKHERPIVLTDWQRAVTRAHAASLVRGLIHSDGSRFVARQRKGGRVYEYVRYDFSNRSDDIKHIFCEHLGLLGIAWTRPSSKAIAVDRRDAVEKLETFVGPKR